MSIQYLATISARWYKGQPESDEHETIMVDFNLILPNLVVGTYPQDAGDINQLRTQIRVTAVLNLQTDDDIRRRGIQWRSLEKLYERQGICARRVPMRDFDFHDQRLHLPRAVKVLRELIDAGHTVYLHCNAGAGRSPLVAMAYLYWCQGMSFQQATGLVKARRHCSPHEELLELSRDPRTPLNNTR